MGTPVLRVCEAFGGTEYRANFHFSNNSCFSSCLNKLAYFVLVCTSNFLASIFRDGPFFEFGRARGADVTFADLGRGLFFF